MIQKMAPIRPILNQGLSFFLVLTTAFMLWKGLSIATDSSSPIVVVLSGSMEPAYHRGDLLFLWNRDRDTKVGDVVVYNVPGKDIPIVHRVIQTFRDSTSRLKLLTKGDNNAANDVELYAPGQTYLDRENDVVGAVRGYIPSIGYVTILLSEKPWLKTVMLAGMGLLAIVQRE